MSTRGKSRTRPAHADAHAAPTKAPTKAPTTAHARQPRHAHGKAAYEKSRYDGTDRVEEES